MGAIRMNFTLPEDVVKILDKKAKPGEKSAFVAMAIREYVKSISKKKLREELIEGYKATAKEDMEEYKEWEVALMDGLDDEY